MTWVIYRKDPSTPTSLRTPQAAEQDANGARRDGRRRAPATAPDLADEGGVAVHIARIRAYGGARELPVPSTVNDLTAGLSAAT